MNLDESHLYEALKDSSIRSAILKKISTAIEFSPFGSGAQKQFKIRFIASIDPTAHNKAEKLSLQLLDIISKKKVAAAARAKVR